MAQNIGAGCGVTRPGDKATEAMVADQCAAYFGRHGLFGRALGYVEHASRLFEKRASQGIDVLRGREASGQAPAALMRPNLS